MLEAARLATTFTTGMDYRGFIADKRTQQAVIMNLMIIGEVATRIANDYPDFIARHPELP